MIAMRLCIALQSTARAEKFTPITVYLFRRSFTRVRAYRVYNSSRIAGNIKQEYHFSKLLVHLENCIGDRVLLLLVIRWNNCSA